MNRSESIKELAAALPKAQAIMQGAVKDSENPHLRNKYADLASVWAAAREPLTKFGFSVVQLPVMTDRGTVAVETILLHESGEFISGIIEIPVSKQDAQGIGSAVTYARRYSLAAMVGIAPEEDDGEAAVGRAPADKKKAPASTPRPEEKTPPAATQEATGKDAEYKDRIRGALRQLYAEDKEAKLAAIETMTSFVGKDGKPVSGIRDYTKLSGKRLEILAHKLEAEVKQGEKEVVSIDGPPFRNGCPLCGSPGNGNAICSNTDCQNYDLPF